MSNNHEHVEKLGYRKFQVKNSVGRIIFIGLSLIIQIAWIIVFYLILEEKYPFISLIITACSGIIVFILNSSKKDSSFKAPFMILILLLPVAGVTFFMLIFLFSRVGRVRKRANVIREKLAHLLDYSEKPINSIKNDNSGIGSQFMYLYREGFPAYPNDTVVYFNDSIPCLDRMKKDLEDAKEFIFMEYFAIEDSIVWDSIYEILKVKVLEGVKVRILYDDLGSAIFINRNFERNLVNDGLECICFNPVMPLYNFFINHRDHRKVTIIDNRIAYTGGFNLADEYFHYKTSFGFWKDTAIRVEGKAVTSMTAMFLEMWNSCKRSPFDSTFERFLREEEAPINVKGFICPYSDSPLDDEPVGENVFINFINNAKNYFYISTPYLILSDEMKRTLIIASKRGVDVRILTPGIPDKKLAYKTTRSYYEDLINAGVKIYEFTPGFNHAKMCAADDEIATCGTINLDFRSLYHHFENGVLIYNQKAVLDIRDDLLSCYESSLFVNDIVSSRINLFSGFTRSLLRIIAPFL